MKTVQRSGVGRVVVLWAMATMVQAADWQTFRGTSVPVGNGHASTFVTMGEEGRVQAIGVRLDAAALENLPQPQAGQMPDFPFQLPMPAAGPRTPVNHVVMNWEALGHPPEKVYDVPHFDFHFYLIDPATRAGIHFHSEGDSAMPANQPAHEHLAAGYVVPPGTAVPAMGVHAIDTGSSEFQGKPFTATFIYGYHHRQLAFLEPMVALSFLKTQPDFAANIARPAQYGHAGVYPSRYRVQYDAAAKAYDIVLDEMR